jgi:pimeloyl-ACP methyl ester carboxylesterase
MSETAKRGLGRTILRWALRIAGGLVALVVLLAASGAAYEAIAARGDAEHYPPPGRMVDVGGHRLHLHCLGSGSPTVVLDAGLGGTSLDWVLVQKDIAETTRACSYDRAGMGWSDAGPMPRTPERIAAELHTLLTNAHIDGPYVLVGHSLGGKNVRRFAIDHPHDVAGMVLVDARSEYMDFHITPEEKAGMMQQLHSAPLQYRVARLIGYVRLFGGTLAGAPAMLAETRRTISLLATNQKSLDAVTSEGENLTADDVTLRDRGGLGDRPLIVLASGENVKANTDWRIALHLQAKLSTQGRLIVAEKSGHYIQWAQPALVIAAVREVVGRVRAQPENPTVPKL